MNTDMLSTNWRANEVCSVLVGEQTRYSMLITSWRYAQYIVRETSICSDWLAMAYQDITGKNWSD